MRRKRSTFKRRYGRKRTFKRKRSTLGKRIKRIVYRAEETKWSTFVAAPAPTAAVPVNFVLNNLAKGTDRNTRIANKISMVSLELKGRLQGVTTSVDGQIVRMILFLDTQADGAIPVFADLFSDPTIANNFVSPRNPNFLKRYRVLKDKTWRSYALSASATTPATGIVTNMSMSEHSFHWRIPLKKKMVNYNDGNAGTIADIIGPSLYIFWMTDLGTAPSITQEIIFRFKDA